MQLRPRHYLMLVIIVGLFVYNIVQYRRKKDVRQAALRQTNTLAAPAWAAFDKAAALRDAPSAQFQPAFDALRAATEGPSTETPDLIKALRDVRGCKTWLLFYRNPTWQANARKHVNGCIQYHEDTIS